MDFGKDFEEFEDGRVFVAGSTFPLHENDTGAAYFYNFGDDSWEELPTPWNIDPDDTPRFSCSVAGDDIIVMTSGTWLTQFFQGTSYVQIYNVPTGTWREGPMLPGNVMTTFSKYVTAPYSDSFVVVGAKDDFQREGATFQWDGSNTEWIERSEKLSHSRMNNVAVLVPVDFC